MEYRYIGSIAVKKAHFLAHISLGSQDFYILLFTQYIFTSFTCFNAFKHIYTHTYLQFFMQSLAETFISFRLN